MKKTNKILFGCLTTFIAIPIIAFAVGAFLYFTADYLAPNAEIDTYEYVVEIQGDSARTCGDNSLILNKFGLWEAHISGSAINRGAAYGALTSDLLKYQEQVFVNQIHEIIPSEWWVEFLHKVIGIFNRNMAENITEEQREEIFALAQSGTHEYDNYGTSYVRQLNYHAAHDIGHALQEYMLVGCSSFATWGDQSEGRNLLIGRNFDFYVGDDFARNKIILFVNPEKGYRFASITWPGMMGVLSGMNEKGLTVTINAAKGSIPTKSATPISLLTRQILQYAQNIEEAYAIAQQCQTFVSESILIGSAQDYCAAIIEKSPEKIALYQTTDSAIVCTNHYQSSAFAEDEYNIDNIATSDSKYRKQRIGELLELYTPITPEKAASILRDSKGLGNRPIGLCNEKSLNQYIGHHSVIFAPMERKMWVSTQPWQIGEMICYDLNKVFSDKELKTQSVVAEEFNIAADRCALVNDYPRVLKQKAMSKAIRAAIRNKEKVSDDYLLEFADNNPEYFEVYNLTGDYLLAAGKQNEAIEMWKTAITKEIPRMSEKHNIEEKIKKYDKR